MPPYNRAMPGPFDLLVLEGMSFYGYHGETEAERTLGNRFYVDVEVRMDLSKAGQSDEIADTLDYSRAFSLERSSWTRSSTASSKRCGRIADPC